MSTKKLSLEERLSLAAKKGKKKSKSSKNVVPSNANKSQVNSIGLTKEINAKKTQQIDMNGSSKETEQELDSVKENTNLNNRNQEQTVKDNDSINEKNNEENNNKEAKVESVENNPLVSNDFIDIHGEKVESVSTDDFTLFKDWLPDNYMSLNVVDILTILKPHIETLTRNGNSINSKKAYNNDSSLLKLIKEKDQIIENLKGKVDQLDKDNQNFNKIMKSDKQKITNLQNNNQSLQSELIGKNQSIKQLQSNLKENNIKLNQLLENNETVSDLKSELKERNDNIESLKSRLLEMELKVNSLEDDLLKEREVYAREKNSIKEATRDQVTTLESKLEQLRIELENYTHLNKDLDSSTTSTNKGSSDNDQMFDKHGKGDDDGVVDNQINMNSIEPSSTSWETQYLTLQEQFNSSKANWNSIEFTLNSKLSDLQENINSSTIEINKLKLKCENNDILIQTLKDDIDKKDDIINKDNVKINSLLNENNKLLNSLQEINEDYSLLQKKFEIQKEQLANNLTNPSKLQDLDGSVSPLNENNIVKENNSDFETESDDNILLKFENDWSLPLPKINDMSESPIQRDLTINDQPEEMFDDINMPFNQRRNSNSDKHFDHLPEACSNLDSFLLNKRTHSFSISNYERKTSTSQLLANIPSVSDISGTFLPPANNIDNGDNRINSNRSNSNVYINDNTIISSTNNQINAQLVSRLGSEVRRMEGELSSLQAAYDQLKNEKNSTNDELLKLIEENEKVKSFQDERDSLKVRVIELEKQLETALQVLGEKTEYAEELENDVQDLKEMMKQQVQQMVQMQEITR